eukprot:341027_1
MATVCVGSTGTGKSSLINVFCTHQVKVGHGTKSETQGSSLIDCIKTGYWMDSQGANDSSGADDEKVLTDILKQLYDKNVNKIKIVWCVSGDMCREKQEFQDQARFIKSLGNGVWNSCLIIKKKGEPQPDEMDGVLAAANHNGASINKTDYKRLFGYTGLEFGDHSKDRMLRLINKIQDETERKQERMECGYLTNIEIVAEVSTKLSMLSPLGIHFENKKCCKCGEKGDPRFVYAPCHTDSEKYHPKASVPYHNGTLITFHTSKLVWYHYGSQVSKSSSSSEWYHPGGDEYMLTRTNTTHTFLWMETGKSYGKWKYKCCKKREGTSGCTQRWNSRSWTEYSCCGSRSSSGCKQKYACCDGSSESVGCRKEWDCCTAEENNQGCQRKHECCDKDIGEEGCEERCKACNIEWGKGPGCVRTSKKD